VAKEEDGRDEIDEASHLHNGYRSRPGKKEVKNCETAMI
jgi:hypothetical protein